ncbi:glycosyltransferase family 4 protein [soil metagenome]
MLGSFGVWTRGTLQARAMPLARELAASAGLQIAIVTTPWDDPEQAGVVERVDDVLIVNTLAVRPSSTPLAVAQQLNILRQLDPSLVHIMKPKAFAGLAGQAILRIGSTRTIIVDHDDWEGDGGWNDHAGYSVAARRLFAFQERSLIGSADGVTVASTLLEERARLMRRTRDDDRITLLPNGLERSWMERLETSRRARQPDLAPGIVLYSRFAEFSLDWLTEMLWTLDTMVSEPITFQVIGRHQPQSPMFSDYRWIRPVWHGFVQRQAIPDLLAEATIALYSYDDNLINRSKQSVKLLELMASGCAVVASDVGDLRRIGGDAVELVDPGDSGRFAEAVHRLIIDRERTAEIGRRARQRVRAYTMDHLATRLYEAYVKAGLS